MSDIAKRVKEIVAEQLGVEEAQVLTESSFMDDLGADSLGRPLGCPLRAILIVHHPVFLSSRRIPTYNIAR